MRHWQSKQDHGHGLKSQCEDEPCNDWSSADMRSNTVCGRVRMTREVTQSGTDQAVEVYYAESLSSIMRSTYRDEPFIQPEQIDLFPQGCWTVKRGIALKNYQAVQSNTKVLLSTVLLHFSRSTKFPTSANTAEKDWLNKHAFYKHIGGACTTKTNGTSGVTVWKLNCLSTVGLKVASD